MDPVAFLQRHRRFLVAASLGAVLFLVGETVVGRTAGASLRSARGTAVRESRKLRESLFGGSSVREARESRDALERAFEALRVRLEAPSGTASDPGASAQQRYFEVVPRAQAEVRAKADAAGVSIDPELGMPVVSPTGREEVARALRALDLVRRVVDLAIESRVRGIPEIRTIAEGKGRRRGAERGGGFLDEVRVSFKVVGSSGSVLDFVEATQKGERILPIAYAAAAAEIEKSTDREGELVASIEFSSLRVQAEREP